jgi:phosphoglycerate dehydrogenase-like enzyme
MLILFPAPEDIRMQYEQNLTLPRDQIAVRTVDTLQEAELLLPDVDILATFGGYLGHDSFRNATRLKWVHSLGTGVDGVLAQPSLRKDTVVTATRGIHAEPMTEAALMMMLALLRDFRRSVHNQDRAEWGDRWQVRLMSGSTAAILGVGLIAETMAPRLKALGVRVIGLSSTPRQIDGFAEVRPRSEILRTVAEADFLISLLPLAPDTHGFISRAVFAAMKPSAYLINLSRGAVVDDDALIEALSSSSIAGAALDSFVQEPLPSSHPLWKAPNLLMSAHMAGHHEGTARATMKLFEENFRFFKNGQVERMAFRVPHG